MMAKTYPRRVPPPAAGPGGDGQAAGAAKAWGYVADAGVSRVADATRRQTSVAGDGPMDADADLAPYVGVMREANSQPLPGALPTMRFWMVILAGMVVVTLAGMITVG